LLPPQWHQLTKRSQAKFTAQFISISCFYAKKDSQQEAAAAANIKKLSK